MPFVTGEWYHCFNRGTEQRVVFAEHADYERFLTLLYVCNGTKPLRISDRRDHALAHFLADEQLERGDLLVDIGVYSLMPTHPHLLLRQRSADGIARFMQKVFTGYTMYFNLKHERTGALFSGTFKSKHVATDDYFKTAAAYILLNHAELFEPQWKRGVADLARLERELRAHRYSSLPDFLGEKRLENKIVVPLSEYYDTMPELSDMLSDALAHYREHAPGV